jgi:hypothetical protein
MTDDTITVSPGSSFKAAMVLAILADALQIVVFPLFVLGAASPADDILDFAVGAFMIQLLGWHWEFLPSFLAKLVPGVDLVPFWTFAVANVYRKSKRIAVAAEENRQEHPALAEGAINPSVRK